MKAATNSGHQNQDESDITDIYLEKIRKEKEGIDQGR